MLETKFEDDPLLNIAMNFALFGLLKVDAFKTCFQELLTFIKAA